MYKIVRPCHHEIQYKLAVVGDRGRARRRRLMELLLSRPTLPALYARLPALCIEARL